MAEEKLSKVVIKRIFTFFADVFSLADVNYKQSVTDIKEGVSFRGFNIWILICSILIASLGLNMNSTAVVIGAMLISPLMGPIVGLGLGVGIYDRVLIAKSLKNIALATVISVATAFIFFKIIPTEEVPELLSRTSPTLLDLFVAFFGGVAGILAAARSLSTNTIPGVAIATALMPPLCTAGFGLAIGNWDYFAGAFYLFLMNSIMISFASLIVVIYLRYPKFSFIDNAKKRQVKAGIFLVVVAIIVPSIYFYYNLLQENMNNDRIENYIKNEIENQPGVHVNNYKLLMVDEKITLQVNVSGSYIETDSILALQRRLEKYSVIGDLKIVQPQPIGFKEQRLDALRTDIIKELYQNTEQKIQNKDDEIAMLKSEVKRLSITTYEIDKIATLAKSQYDLQRIAVNNLIYNNNDSSKDTTTTALVKWNRNLGASEKKQQANKLSKLLEIQLSTKNIEIIEIK